MTTHPAFVHPVFEQLYERDYFIDDAVLHQILALGPEAAVPELLKIANHTLDTFNYDTASIDDWYAHYHFLHALHLLCALHAPEALDVYGRLLRFNADYSDFWFGFDFFEVVPILLADAGQTRLPELLALLDDGQLPFMHRLAVSEAVSRVARTQPETRPAVTEFMQRHLRHIIAHANQRAELFPPDTDSYGYGLDNYLAGMLLDMQQSGLRELEPETRALHRLGLVDKSMAGGESKINFDRTSPLQPAFDIFALYQQERNDLHSYSPHHPDADAIAKTRAEEEAGYEQQRRELLVRQARLAPPKAGRNDPCPCGSGKKYKKCHG